MTMPHLMNCGHSDTGWCLDCVKALHDEKESLDNLINDIDDLTTDVLPDADSDSRGTITERVGAAVDGLMLIGQIRAALGTEEVGEALVEVAKNAHRAELELSKIHDEHHAMMNGPRIAQAFNLPPVSQNTLNAGAGPINIAPLAAHHNTLISEPNESEPPTSTPRTDAHYFSKNPNAMGDLVFCRSLENELNELRHAHGSAVIMQKAAIERAERAEKECDGLRSRFSKEGDALAVAVKALGWYAGMLRPEDRLNDSGDKATAALIVMMEKLK